MKKYIILMLLLMFFVTGCGNKKFQIIFCQGFIIKIEI